MWPVCHTGLPRERAIGDPLGIVQGLVFGAGCRRDRRELGGHQGADRELHPMLTGLTKGRRDELVRLRLVVPGPGNVEYTPTRIPSCHD